MPDPRPSALELRRGDIVWAAPDPSVGREQTGRRPAVVVAGGAYLANITQLAVVVPITTTERGWPNHVALVGAEVGLDEDCYAMTEQIKTIDRRRIDKVVGRVDEDTQRSIDQWLTDFLGLHA